MKVREEETWLDYGFGFWPFFLEFGSEKWQTEVVRNDPYPDNLHKKFHCQNGNMFVFDIFLQCLPPIIIIERKAQGKPHAIIRVYLDSSLTA